MGLGVWLGVGPVECRPDCGMLIPRRSLSLPLARLGKGNQIHVRVPLTMWGVLLVVCCGWLCGVQAQPPPAAVILPPPGVSFPPPGAVMPPPGVAVPPSPPVDVAMQMLQQQVQDLTRNIAASVEKKYSFCITNG